MTIDTFKPLDTLSLHIVSSHSLTHSLTQCSKIKSNNKKYKIQKSNDLGLTRPPTVSQSNLQQI